MQSCALGIVHWLLRIGSYRWLVRHAAYSNAYWIKRSLPSSEMKAPALILFRGIIIGIWIGGLIWFENRPGAEFFSAFNYTQWGSIDTGFVPVQGTVGSSNSPSSAFGSVSGARPRREIQFALKLIFRLDNRSRWSRLGDITAQRTVRPRIFRTLLLNKSGI
jgi:hypothetical protein